MSIFVPSLAVIIPAYNVEPWIDECLESVINQTVLFDEIIIIDDGSTDRTHEICQHYAENNSRIRLFRQVNRGLGAARNYCIDLVESDYFILIDADDRVSCSTCEVLIKTSREKKPDILFFDGVSFGDETLFSVAEDYYSRDGGFSEKVYEGKELFELMYPQYYRESACLAMYRSDYIRNNGIKFPEGIYHEDCFFSFKVIQLAKKVMYKSIPIYERRFRTGSITNSQFSDRHFVSLIISSELIWTYSYELVMDMKKQAIIYVISLWNNIFERIIKYGDMIINNHLIGNHLDEAIKCFFTLLLKLYRDSHIAYNSDEIRFRILNSLLQILKLDIFDIPRDITLFLTELMNWGMEYFSSLFEMIEFSNEEICIGIFGVGKCTADMLTLYEKMYGEIKAKFVYIDSNKANKMYRGKLIKKYEDIKGNIDRVVVSSSRYHNEIREVIRLYDTSIPIIDPYEGFDFPIFSCAEELMVETR